MYRLVAVRSQSRTTISCKDLVDFLVPRARNRFTDAFKQVLEELGGSNISNKELKCILGFSRNNILLTHTNLSPFQDKVNTIYTIAQRGWITAPLVGVFTATPPFLSPGRLDHLRILLDLTSLGWSSRTCFHRGYLAHSFNSSLVYI